MREDLNVKQFLNRVHHMPLEEAETELVLRKERATMEVGMLHTELHRLGETGTATKKKTEKAQQVGRAMAVVHTDITLISEALRAVRQKMSDTSWRKAVVAIYGQEGYEKCRLWMAINSPMEPVQAESEITYLRNKGVTLEP